jgi:signal transduction histidine kinase
MAGVGRLIMHPLGEAAYAARVFDVLRHGLIFLDSHWRVVSANTTAERLLRISRQETSGKSLWEIAERFPHEFIESIRGAERFPVSFQYQREGCWIELELTPVDEVSRIIQVRELQGRAWTVSEDQQRALNREIAARHEAEAASAEIRSILERIGDAYIAFDTEWRYTYVNWRAAELAQKPASELIGRCVWDEFPEAVKTPFYSELHRAMREQTPVEFDNYFAPLGRWFENSVYPSPSGVGVYYRDITERVRIHRALEKRTADLARKNSELHMFAYIASHDLQEPLRMIGGYAALLAKRYSGVIDREADEFIQFMTAGVDRMQRLIKGLLALCRLEEAGEAPYCDVDSGQVLDLVCENLDLLIEDTDAVIERKELPVIQFEEMQLLQVMQNLVSNALKYRMEAPRIVVGARREGAGWTFFVSDNGIGFEGQSAEQIFMPFKRLQKADDGGTGIGLAICKKIIESRGGRIWAESTPCKGSTFFFSIPDAPPAAD